MKNLSTDEEGAELAIEEINEETGIHYGNLILLAKGVHISLGPDCKALNIQMGLPLSLSSFSVSFHMRCIDSKACSTLEYSVGVST